MQLLTYINGWMNLDATGESQAPLADRLTGAEERIRETGDGVIRVRWSATEREAFSRKVDACLGRAEPARYFHDCNFLD